MGTPPPSRNQGKRLKSHGIERVNRRCFVLHVAQNMNTFHVFSNDLCFNSVGSTKHHIETDEN